MAMYGLPHLEVSQWSSATFTPEIGGSQQTGTNWIAASRPGPDFPNYHFGDEVTLRIQSNMPNATVYIWRRKDGRQELAGVPLPHGINQTDANGHLQVSFSYDQVGFAGYYSDEYFSIGSPNGPVSNVITPYILEQQTLNECNEIPVPHTLEKSASDPSDFGLVKIGETATASRSVLNDGPYGSCLDIRDISFEWFHVTRTGSQVMVHYNQPSPHFSSAAGFTNRQGVLSPNLLARREIAWVAEYFHPQTQVSGSIDGMMRMTVTIDDPTSASGTTTHTFDSFAVGYADNPNYEPAYFRHGRRSARSDIEHTGHFTGTLPLGTWLNGSTREYELFNPNPAGSNVSFRGTIAVRTPWRLTYGSEPPFPLSCVAGPTDVVYHDFLIDPQEFKSFNLEYVGTETGPRDQDILALQIWRVRSGGADENLGYQCITIESDIIDDQPFIALAQGSPLVLEPTALGDPTFNEVVLPLQMNAYGDAALRVQGDQQLSAIDVRTAAFWGDVNNLELGSVTVASDRDASANLIIDFEDGGTYETNSWPSQTIPVVIQGRPRLKALESVIDFGEVLPDEEVFLQVTLLNLARHQRLSGRMRLPGFKSEGEVAISSTRNPERPFLFETSPGTFAQSIDFEGMASSGPGPYDPEPGLVHPDRKFTATVRFKHGTPGIYQGKVDINLCDLPGSECETYDSEEVTLSVRATVIGPEALRTSGSELGYQSGTIEVDYDVFGNQKAVVSPSGHRAEYSYNQARYQTEFDWLTPENQHHSMIAVLEPNSFLGYDQEGRPLHLRNLANFGNEALDVIRRYDDLGRVRTYALAEPIAPQDFDPDDANHTGLYHALKEISYDLERNVLGFQALEYGGSGAHPIQFSYDDYNRLTDFIHGQDGFIQYIYDDSGNMLSRVSTVSGVPTIDQSFDDGNKVVGYSYDANGRVTFDGNFYYHYNAQGRIGRITDETGGLIAQYLYGPDQERVRVFTGDRSTYYFRLGDRLLEEREVDHAQDEATTVRVHGYFNENKHGYLTLTDTETRYTFTHNNHLESPMVSQTQDVLALHKYSPFGIKYVETANILDTCDFSAHEWDEETGNHYMHHRYYDGEGARFLTPDPKFDMSPENPSSYNLYQYAFNNPFNNTDPTGEEVQGAARRINVTVGGQPLAFFHQFIIVIPDDPTAFAKKYPQVKLNDLGGGKLGFTISATNEKGELDAGFNKILDLRAAKAIHGGSNPLDPKFESQAKGVTFSGTEDKVIDQLIKFTETYMTNSRISPYPYPTPLQQGLKPNSNSFVQSLFDYAGVWKRRRFFPGKNHGTNLRIDKTRFGIPGP